MACGAALMAVLSAHAQSPLSVELALGVDGVYVAGRWNAATVRVDNPGPALRGIVTIEVRGLLCGLAGSAPPDASYCIPTLLPTGTSELHTALIAPPYGGSATVTVTSKGTVVFRNRWEMGELGETAYRLVLAITERRDTTWLEQSERDLVVLSPPEAPADARAWDAADCVLLDDVSLADLSPAARRAIVQWTATGGSLVLTAPFLARNHASEHLRELTYLEPAVAPQLAAPIDPRPIFLPDAAFAARTTRLVACAPRPTEVLAAAGGRAIVFEHPLGAGRVRGVTIDSAWMTFAAPGDALEFERAFWAALLDESGQGAYQRSDLPWSLVAAQARLGSFKVPLLVYLGLFVLVMGPANFLLLRRLRRREWMVVTAPVAAVVFVAAAVLLSRALHEDRPVWVHESVTVCAAGTPSAGTLTLNGLLSPRTARWDVALPAADTPLREFVEDVAARYEGHHLPPLRMGEAGSMIDDMPVTRWAMRSVHYPQVATDGGVRGELLVSGGRATGWVHSRLPFELRDCTVVHKWHSVALGSLPPGATRSFELPLGPPELSEGTLRRLEPLTRLDRWLGWELWNAGGDRRRWYLAQWASEGLLSGCAEPLLIGWGSAPVAGAQLQATGTAREEEHLYVARLPIAAGGPVIEIPVGAAPTGRGMQWSQWLLQRVWGEDTSAYYREERGRWVMELLLPLEATALRHERLSIHGRFVDVPGEGFLPRQRLAVYNWRTHTWDELAEPVQQQFEVPVPDPEAAIGMPRGLVRVSVQTADDEAGYSGESALEWLDVSYQGGRAGS
ncbi:MAG: hypothetical protein AB7Y46_18685 [Armatimonadota bacterium]